MSFLSIVNTALTNFLQNVFLKAFQIFSYLSLTIWKSLLWKFAFDFTSKDTFILCYALHPLWTWTKWFKMCWKERFFLRIQILLFNNFNWMWIKNKYLIIIKPRLSHVLPWGSFHPFFNAKNTSYNILKLHLCPLHQKL